MSDATAFPIVGIGCSAGGLEALEAFLSHVPVDCQAAFVIVQHLDAKHKSHLPTLLQRITQMQVNEITDQIQLQPRNVYVIPPAKILSIQQRKLVLMPKQTAEILTIDYFFCALAEDQKSDSIAIVLSGMGSDGVVGLQAIKKQGGLCLVQEPSSAQSPNMPHSAIEAGLADYIAPPAELAELIMSQPVLPITANQTEPELPVGHELDRFMALLYQHTGHDFKHYKTAMVLRRLERRMALHQFTQLDDYYAYIESTPEELDFIFGELLIGVTQFFRDPNVWEYITLKLIPMLLEAHPAGIDLRAWVPACSTGEEAYTLAICFKDALETLQPRVKFNLRIYATDLDDEAITKARAGFYPKSIEKNIAPARLQRYFLAKEGGYQIKSEIREMLTFAQHNIITDPAFTKMDIITCRNLLIYFDGKLQAKLLPLLHFSLNQGGILLLGNSEGVGGYSNLFAAIEKNMRVYRRLVPTGELLLPNFDFKLNNKVKETVEHTVDLQSIEYLTDQLIQQNYAPAAVLVNNFGDIVYISGRIGKYLEPAAGKASMNIYSMARPGLREALVGMVDRALKQAIPIILHDLNLSAFGQKYRISVTLQATNDVNAMEGKVLVVFQDLPELNGIDDYVGKDGSDKEKQLAQKLLHNRTALQLMHSEMQTSLNQFKTTNMTLQATNDELQAINEELTISKEESQSLNEEMQIVNAELQTTVDELSWTRNDMINLLDSTELATVFLDGDLKIRRFTKHATELYKLIPRDVGRLFSDIVSELDYTLLEEDVIDVLKNKKFKEVQVPLFSGGCYRVRIMPYKTINNVIDGVVITFVNISEIINLENEVQALKASLGHAE